jgi:hypothetical protein
LFHKIGYCFRNSSGTFATLAAIRLTQSLAGSLAKRARTQTIQDWLGHRAVQHTVRYTVLTPMLFDAMDAVMLAMNHANIAFPATPLSTPCDAIALRKGGRAGQL